MTFRQELTKAINRCSMENGSNTPDFILAKYLMDCLNAYDNAVSRRDHLRSGKPGPDDDPTQDPVNQPDVQ